MSTEAGTSGPSDKRQLLFVNDGQRFLAIRRLNKGLQTVPCNEMFGILKHSDKVRAHMILDLLNAVTQGSGSALQKACDPDRDFDVHMTVFGVRGIVLSVQVSEKLLDLLQECTSKSVDTISRLASEENCKKLHEVKRFGIARLLESIERSRSKVVPEVMHILRNFSLQALQNSKCQNNDGGQQAPEDDA